MYKAIVVNKDPAGYHCELKTVEDETLPQGDVTIQIQYSSLNYKDGLAISGKGPIIRQFPMVPGIDLAGTVLHSDSSAFSVAILLVKINISMVKFVLVLLVNSERASDLLASVLCLI